MYRLVLYYLIGLILVSMMFGFLGVTSMNPFSVLFSSVIFTIFCLIVNIIFSKTFRAQTNIESVYITALILVLIISPPENFTDTSYFIFAFWASVWAMASKYIFAIKKKHIFNPAGFAVFLTSFTINQSASWWIGTEHMAIFVLIGGLLVVRKIKRSDMVFSFIVVALATIVASYISGTTSLFTVVQKTFLDSAIMFFAFVMLTEPLTTPPTTNGQMLYGGLIGFMFAPAIHIGPIYSTPELALTVGNIFSYIISPKKKLLLKLKEKIKIGLNTYDFIFDSDQKLNFKPGQYLEWTLGHKHSDNRGNRRYFTIASSPTENEIRLGVKFYDNPSSFKKSLLLLQKDEVIIASQLAGNFVLPKNPQKKLVFIAGGIGVTPFRSMIKYLVDKNEDRPIIMLYGSKTSEEVVYKNVFDSAKKIGIKTIYVIGNSDQTNLPQDVKIGMINPDLICEVVPDYKEREFYISGPHTMVKSFEASLNNLGVKKRHIKTDFFPGFV
jgi:ferredoxin-NADP reductase/Na+-translocating ferredoxin:NAD+ oxidoreductase RnfD subunit